jgi:hypothetical protein
MYNKTLATNGDECKSGRNFKERLTALLPTAVMGKKLTSFVIGKANQLRCVNNFNVNSLQLCEELINWYG